jgi:leader peptidase (prepilin peptidase)/N-methyltransferase
VPVVAWLTFLHFSLFVLGCAVGSFLNVCIYRMATGRSIAWPGSYCGACIRPIPGKYNIPLWSWLWLRGRCAMCGAAFSMRYFWVELATGVLFAGLYALEIGENWHGYSIWQFKGWWFLTWGILPPWSIPYYLTHLWLLCLLILAIGTLYDSGTIPDVVVGAGTLFSLGFALLGDSFLLWPTAVPAWLGMWLVPAYVRTVDAAAPGTFGRPYLGLTLITGGFFGWPLVALAVVLSLYFRRSALALAWLLAGLWLTAPLLRQFAGWLGG